MDISYIEAIEKAKDEGATFRADEILDLYVFCQKKIEISGHKGDPVYEEDLYLDEVSNFLIRREVNSLAKSRRLLGIA